MKMKYYVLGATCALLLAGCGGGNPTPTPVDVTGVTLNETSKALEVGQTFQLQATVAPSDATIKDVTWSASGDGIVSVDDGLVTALKAGESTVTVTTVSGKKTASCVFTVSEAVVHVSSVSLDKTSASIKVGESVTLTPTVLPADAANKSVTWSASGDGIVSVTDGVVKGLKEGTSTVTVTTVDGSKTATCAVTVAEGEPKPEGAVDLEYSTADTLSEHGDDYCYFNDPSRWTGATAEVNEAYFYEGTIVFDYTYDPTSSATAQNWTVQLMRKNSLLKEGTTYDLSFKLKSDKAGKIVVNNKEVTIAQGDNNVLVSYKESSAASFALVFPLQTIGSARVEISDIKWEAALMPPVGVVVNLVEDHYIVAFAAVEGATGYKAYYVKDNVDVDSEVVTNGGTLTKVSSLEDGKYRVYVTTLKGDKESAKSSSYGMIEVGDPGEVVPAGGPKTDMEFGEEHAWPSTDLALPDDKFVYWNDQNWNGSTVQKEEAYTEEGTIHASYKVIEGNCDYGFQILYKNSSLTAKKNYLLSFTINASVSGRIKANDTADIDLVANTDVKVSFEYTEVANNASMKITFPTSLGDNSFVISNISWEAVLMPPEGVVVNLVEDHYIVAFAAVEGATGYKVYYVKDGVDVDSETVTNGGTLTKISSLADGKYKIYVTSLKGDKESARSKAVDFEKGEHQDVVPAGGPKTNIGFGEEHTAGVLALPDDKFVYWNDQGWCGSSVSVNEGDAYTEEGTVHVTYTVDHEKDFIPSWAEGQTVPGCDYAFQLFYKNTSLTAASSYKLSIKLNTLSAGQIKFNNQAFDVAVGDNTLEVSYTEVANDASFALVFPSSMNSNTIVVSNISWTPAN